MSPDKVNVADKLARFSEHFQPKIVGELNGQHVKLVKFQGEFVWHSHEAEDEMFFVLSGAFDMQFRDRTVRVGEGEFLARAEALAAEHVREGLPLRGEIQLFCYVGTKPAG